MSAPEVSLASLRGFLGQLTLRATTALTSNRSLRKLRGGLTIGDTDVRDVFGELVDEVDAIPTAAATATTTLVDGDNDQAAQKNLGVFYMETVGAGLETIATIAVSTAVHSVWVVEADVAILSDDSLVGAAFKVARSFLYDGSLSPIGALVKMLEQEGSAATTNVDIAVSGTNIVVQVGVTPGFRAAASVRYTRLQFT